MAMDVMHREKKIPVQVRNNAAYSPNQVARIVFDDVQPLADGTTYVRGVHLAADLVITTAGGSTMPEAILPRIFESIFCRNPGGHVFYDLPSQAGCALRCMLHAMMGIRPHAQGGGGNIVLANGANNVRVKTYLPFALHGGVEFDDANIPLSDLRDTAIEVAWGNGVVSGIFDAGGDDTTITTGTLRADVDLVARDEYRRGAYFTIGSFNTPGVEDRLSLEDRVLHWLLEIPVHADGLTESFITDAARDLVTLEWDGQTFVDREDTRDLCPRWNRIHTKSRVEELPQVETNTAPWIPWFAPSRRPYKMTQLPLGKKALKYRVTGTSLTPRVIWATTLLNDRQRTLDHIDQSGQDVPDDYAQNPEQYLTAKTAGKSPIRAGRGGFQRMPIKLHKRPMS